MESVKIALTGSGCCHENQGLKGLKNNLLILPILSKRAIRDLCTHRMIALLGTPAPRTSLFKEVCDCKPYLDFLEYIKNALGRVGTTGIL